MSCQHDGRRPYTFALGRRQTQMCNACHDALVAATGMWLAPVERRSVDLPVLRERRHSFVPRWISRLTARDESGRIAA